MQIKLSNFKSIATDYAEVDVEITKGFWPFKTKHIETQKIVSLYGGNWFFLDTGEITPDYQAERLYRAYAAKKNLHRIKQAEAVEGKRMKTFEEWNNDGKEYESVEAEFIDCYNAGFEAGKEEATKAMQIKLNDKDKELEALREYARTMIRTKDTYFARWHGLIDENDNPTSLLTGDK